ncbi:MAG: 4a-hydroxytetrahydrobiopterin dehydratase [Bacteroidetes bacterium]|nr:MAG: 4a-hydroxytetrahydrobiopterin dehydratase [Bacteroidota bacterium]
MADRTPLSANEIEHALLTLSGWIHDNNKLHKEFVLDSFRDAMAFMVRISYEAEQRDHHPEWSNVYNKVSISLSTHDAGNVVTGLDIELAREIEKLI